MLVHCNTKFRPDEIQFLYDDEIFTNRKLEIGVCPHCEKLIAKLTEHRKVDNMYCEMVQSKSKAERLIKECSNDIWYSSLDANKPNKVLYGFRYGENTETINKKTGEKIITQKACDWFGNKEKVNPNMYENLNSIEMR